MNRLDKMGMKEFKKIVREMVPKIGVFGGRYFKTAKKTYTMNQITKKYFDLIDAGTVNRFGQEGVEISTLIVAKDEKATALLKKASLCQKKMTKIKRKWGNRIFKGHYSKFIGKTEALQLMRAVSQVSNTQIPSEMQTEIPAETLAALQNIDSAKLVSLGRAIASRDDFKAARWESPPAIWAYSKDLLPEDIMRRLITLKKDLACSVKYEIGDVLTNMEGALHTFLTPISRIHMVGDKAWKGAVKGVFGKNFDGNQARQVVFSGVVQPDFQFDCVFMKIACIRDEAVEGKELGEIRDEDSLQRHMIHCLTCDHRLPSIHEVQVLQLDEENILSTEISTEQVQKMLRGKAILVKDKMISLEVMFNTYLHQIRNEMRLLEDALPQGYVYTMSPPSIFLEALGEPDNVGVKFNFLQALALKCVHRETPLHNMKVVAFDDFADMGMVDTLKLALPDKAVISTSLLYKGDKGDNTYLGNPLLPEEVRKLCEGAALVIHNNSDGFGQNIEFEGGTSLDGVVGINSDAYATVARHRTDYFTTSSKGDYRALEPIQLKNFSQF